MRAHSRASCYDVASPGRVCELEGTEAAIVTVEPPYPVVGEDLYRGARYFWEPSFTSDVGRLLGALDRIARYVSHYYAIDGSRVVLAGEGTGATVAPFAALHGGFDPASSERALDASLGERSGHRARSGCREGVQC